MNEPESSFHFTNKHQQNAGDNIWYKKSPLEKNEVRKLLLKAAQNNSIRRTCTSNYLIQTYLWLSSSVKWLPECEKSQDLY